MKTRTIVGYVAVAFACAYACGGTPAPSVIILSTRDDGGAVDSGGNLTVTDASAVDRGEMDVASKDVASDGSDGRVEDDATDAGSNTNTNSSQYCCVAGAFYLCPNAAAITQCTSACTHNPSYDAVCVSFDAGSSSGGGGSLPPPPAPPTNGCGGSFLGVPSMTGGQCYGSDEHAMGNTCYPNDVGNPCTYPNDCGAANHCMNGCCQSPAKGSPCEAPWDCKSKMCTNNVCQ